MKRSYYILGVGLASLVAVVLALVVGPASRAAAFDTSIPSGDDYDWCVLFDYRVESFGHAIDASAGGTYTKGYGYISDDTVTPGRDQVAAYVTGDNADSTIEYQGVWVRLDDGFGSVYSDTGDMAQGGILASPITHTTGPTLDSGYEYYSTDLNSYPGDSSMYWRVSESLSNVSDVQYIVGAAIFAGTGDNPFPVTTTSDCVVNGSTVPMLPSDFTNDPSITWCNYFDFTTDTHGWYPSEIISGGVPTIHSYYAPGVGFLDSGHVFDYAFNASFVTISAPVANWTGLTTFRRSGLRVASYDPIYHNSYVGWRNGVSSDWIPGQHATVETNAGGTWFKYALVASKYYDTYPGVTMGFGENTVGGPINALVTGAYIGGSGVDPYAAVSGAQSGGCSYIGDPYESLPTPTPQATPSPTPTATPFQGLPTSDPNDPFDYGDLGPTSTLVPGGGPYPGTPAPPAGATVPPVPTTDPAYTPGVQPDGSFNCGAPDDPCFIATPFIEPTATPDFPDAVVPGFNHIASVDYSIGEGEDQIFGLAIHEYDFGCPINVESVAVDGVLQLCIRYLYIEGLNFFGEVVPAWPFAGLLVLMLLGGLMKRIL